MRDLIERQAAIDAFKEYEKRVDTAAQVWTIRGCKDEILKLPSAQPEIIRCKDCKWWERSNDNIGYCHATKHCHYSTNWEISIYRRQRPDFYCADAERRTDD